MAFDFPNTPAVNDLYQPAGGPQYRWDGQKWAMTGSLSSFAPAYDYRNRIVNGAMQISQELGDSGSSISGTFPADQWQNNYSISDVGSYRNKSYVTPYGSNCVLVVTYNTPKPSLVAGDYSFIGQSIEGIRVVDFQWGTVSAKQVILGFYIYSDIVGTFSVAIRNVASDRSWVGTYNIAAGDINKFVRRTLIIPGDTTGTWPKDNTKGLEVNFTFVNGGAYAASTAGWNAGNFVGMAGQTNGAAATNTFLLADVGLYLDASNSGIPPAWEMPDEAQELIACMRYYEVLAAHGTFFGGYSANGAQAHAKFQWSVTKRTIPSVTGTSSFAYRFPNTIGSLVANNAVNGYEYRTANGTGDGSYYASTIVGSARM